MNNLTHAVQIAVSVRNYLRESAEIPPTNMKELSENHDKIAKQVRNITKL